MIKTRYTQEFKAVGRVVEKGYRVATVAAQLAVSQHSLHAWTKERRLPAAERQTQAIQSEDLRRLKAEVWSVTEKRDIPTRAATYFTKQYG